MDPRGFSVYRSIDRQIQRPDELLVPGLLPFRDRPTPDFFEIDRVGAGHGHRLIQRLTIAPVVESCKTIHDALSRREDLDAQCTNENRRPLTNQLLPNRQRPRRKLKRVWTTRMHEVSAGFPEKTERAQNCLNLSMAGGRDEVEISGDLHTVRVNLNHRPS